MNKNKIKLAILAVSSLLMASMTASAILADISTHFIGVDQSIIQMVLTIPSLIGMIFALISGPLSLKIAKKTIVIFGLACALIGGVVALIFGGRSIYILLISSALIGVAQGINSTMTIALISDYFQGDESSSLMGLQSAFVNGGSVFILIISGMLAGIKWNYSYLIYLVFIPVILIALRNLPNEPPVQKFEADKTKKGKLNGTIFFVIFMLFTYSAFSFVLQTNIALHLNNSQLGDASTGGMVNSLMVGIGMVTGVLYGRIKKVLRDFTIPVAFTSAAGGLFILATVHTLPAVFISSALAGFGLSLLVPTAMFIVSTSVDPSMSATAISLAMAGSNIGMFISPLLINPLSLILGDGSENTKFMISAVAILVLVVISIAGKGLYTEKKTKNAME